MSNRDTANNTSTAPGIGAVDLVILALVALAWWWGMGGLAEAFDLQLDCEPGVSTGSAHAAESLRCAIEAGGKGWVWTAWALTPPIIAFIWAERRLRNYIKARGGQASR